MHMQDDRRQFIRMDVEQPLTYKFQDSLKCYPGTCRNLSSSGILFTAYRNNINVGDVLEIQINTDNNAVSSLKMLVEIIRATLIEKQIVEVAGQIKGTKI